MSSSPSERRAFDALVTETSPAVWRLLRRLTADDATAEEALQETYVAAWRGLSTAKDPGLSWLYGIARRQAARTWRRRAGEPTFAEPLDEELGACAGWGSDPELAASRAEDRGFLFAALAQLGEDDRTILSRCDLEGNRPAEIADELGLTANAARVRLHRARLKLMTALRTGGFDG